MLLPPFCAVRVKCIYNSTAYWIREIYLYTSPSTKQIIYAEIHDPYIEFKDIKGLINTMTTITAIIISILLIIEIIIYEKYLRKD